MVNDMPCNCGGRKNNAAASAQASAAQGARAVTAFTNDDEMEMVRYMKPNRGDHPVWGLATRKFYGHRKGAGAETFLVHRSDIAAQPLFFVVVSDVPAPPQVTVQAPPPPTVMVEAPLPPAAPPPVTNPEPKVTIQHATPIKAPVVVDDMPPPNVMAKAMNAAKFDLQTLPGVTPNIATGMAELSLVTAEAIFEAGVKGLRKVRGVGKTKAEMIYGYVAANFTDPNN
jgi:hypothetical protein